MRNRLILTAAFLWAIVGAAPHLAKAASVITPVSVNLSSSTNVYALFDNGSAVTHGGADGGGYAYSGTLSGTGVVWSGSTFSLGTAGTANAVSNATIALPQGHFSTLQMLATSVDGSHANQNFLVNYTDGSTTTITQSISDWVYTQNYAGESAALTMAYRLGPLGTRNVGPVYLYGYSFALNGYKTVQSITLPNNRGVLVLGLSLTPATATTLTTGSISASTP